MPSVFAQEWANAQSLVDDQWGEPTRLEPKAKTGGSKYVARSGDYAASPRDVVGIFRDTPIIDTVKGSGANTHENVDVLTRRTSVDFDQTLFEDDGADRSTPEEGWIIVATSQPKMPRYKIVSVEPDGIARIFCKISFLDYSPT